MSHWSTEDKIDFFNGKEPGQINLQSTAGNALCNLIASEVIKKDNMTIVDIGTWNGLGTTYCILEGAIQNPTTIIYSLENNGEKVLAARDNLKQYLRDGIHILWGSIVSTDDITDDYLSEFEDIETRWLRVDMENCNACPNVLHLLPEKIDCLVLDGGEYTSLKEFQILFNRCTNWIVLDDANTAKCKRVYEILQGHSGWEEIIDDYSRPGFHIFKKYESTN